MVDDSKIDKAVAEYIDKVLYMYKDSNLEKDYLEDLIIDDFIRGIERQISGDYETKKV